jgi:hypothetical protein
LAQTATDFGPARGVPRSIAVRLLRVSQHADRAARRWHGWSRRAVPYDQAEARAVAAIAAGGHLVTDRHTPSFWVLAAAEGTGACVSATMSCD